MGSAPSCSSTRQSKRVYTDRFIPAAADTSHFEVTNGAENAVDANASPAGQYVKELAYRKELASTLLGGQPPGKVLSFSPQAPPPPDRKMDELCAMYRHNCSAGLAPKRYRRHIATEAERILDAPKLLDDFYLNLLDWSEGNVLGVALADEVPPALHTTTHPPTHQPTTTHPPIHPPATTHLPIHPPVCAIRQIYLWNAADASVHKLCETPPDTHVTSLAWAQQAGPSSSLLAVGTSDHKVQLWDVEKQRQVRSMDGHSARVSSLAWNRNLLSSGGRDSLIVHHDVRVAAHRCGTLKGHAQEVCGLRWSPWGTQLASGGNDNLLNIWDDRYASTNTHTTDQSLFRLDAHQAAVKALAWCPWQRNLLASGGGTADRTIKFWNSTSGAMINSVDTKSQVCALQWSAHDKELVSSHGYSHNQLILWKYPSMVRVAELTGHTSRVLHMAQSPDGTTICSAAADETLRFWKVLSGGDQNKKTKAAAQSSVLSSAIR